SLARPAARRSFRLVEVFHTTTLRTLKQRLQMKLHHPLFARSDLLVYVCNTQREYWRERGLRAKADTVVYNGIDADRYTDIWSSEDKLSLRRSLGFSADDFVVGLCAVFRPEKAHGDLLQAIAALRAKGIPAVGLFVGDGPERPHVESEVRRLGLTDHVRITGMIKDVRPYLAIADVMTLVSHAIETFSLAALEAMAMGKPMVMTRVGGAEELVRDGHNGLLFATGNIEALTGHLSRLANAATRIAFGAAAQAIVRERFTTQHMTEEFAACLWQLASNDTLFRRESSSATTSFVQTHSARL
ncbi:MAG: glycosyltransferase, partial [Steroidobacteraceae bacterium]